MEDLISYITAISENGLMMVLSALFVYAAVRIINMLLKRFEADEHGRLLDMRAESSLKAQILIDNVLAKSGADRVTVVEFHNGQENFTHLPFNFMTCTLEAFKDGLLPIHSKIDRVSTSLFSVYLSNLQKFPYVILNTQNRDSNLAMAAYELVAMQGSTMALCVMMYSLQKRPIGYITMKRDTDFTDADIELLKSTSQQLSILLDFAYTKKTKK